jgi:hypothetical protein
MSTTPHPGACLCGGVRYEVDGPLDDVVVCHCSRCRRTHGHVGAYTACSAGDLRLLDSGSLRWYVADGRERGFCDRCGSSIFWRVTGDGEVSIAAGTVDEPTGLKTVSHIYTATPGDYYELAGEGEHHGEGLP